MPNKQKEQRETYYKINKIRQKDRDGEREREREREVEECSNSSSK